MEQFRKLLSDCGLADLGYKGVKYTYSNKRQGRYETKCRLDRAVGDDLWFESHPYSIVNHLTSHRSDHCPLILLLEGNSSSQKRPFRFESMWTRDANFLDTISKNWISTGNFTDKLSNLSQQLQVWNKKTFGQVGVKLRNLKEELSETRKGMRTISAVDREKNIEKEIDEWLVREEIMWSQRSRVAWLSEGDNNTRFFHLKANARRRSNTVYSLIDKAGKEHSIQSKMEEVAVSYFQELFETSISLSDAEINNHLQCIPYTISEAQNRALLEPYSDIEIQMALFQLSPFKAPGLDGYPAGFFQKYWNVIRRDFTETCLLILNEDSIPPGSNDTLIVLIPKHSTATKMEEYRPISLTSVVSKTVAKVIVNRLQQILPEIISPAQSAFIKGRLITDNFLIAHETAHFIKNTRQGRKGYGSLKLDMSKAYDRIEWRFLKLLLLRFGFEGKWVSMILKYVTSVRYAICINGKITSSFIPNRGLRQGDPLSPYLFILCSEWLSYSLSKLQMNRRIEGIRISRGAPHVTHLMFADDCLLLFKVEDSTAAALTNLLRNYESISGQMVNYNKSELVLSPNINEATRQSLQSQLSVKLVNQHEKFLGLPLSLKRKLTLNFSGMIDKFWNKTDGWKAKNLSTGGKEILIKAVLQALPQYAMNCFKLPEDTIKKMNTAIKRYWWASSARKKPIHWVKGQILNQDKEMGGLGFKDLKSINLAFLAKQAWRIYNQPDLLVSKILKARYCRNSDMYFCSVGYKPSFCWRSIVKGFEVVRAGSFQDLHGNVLWTANSTGCFDLKSAYKLMMKINGMDSTQDIGCSDYSQCRKFWQSFWKIAVPRKVKIFGWRGLHEALPTGISLHKRGLTDNVSCVECGYKIETYAHIFLHCWIARATWDQLGIEELGRLPDTVSFADIIQFSQSHYSNRKVQLILVTLWLLWHNRNKKKHGEIGYSLHEIIHRASNQSRVFAQNDAKYLSSLRFLYSSDFEWKKPPVGFIKINCDASVKDREGGGIEIIARDSDSNILAVRSFRKVDIQSSSMCEGIGLMESLRMAESLTDKVIFESDCAEAVKWFNICPDLSIAKMDWFKSSMHLLNRYTEWKIFLILREANVVADLLAKHALNHNWCWTRLDCCPRLACLSS